MTQFLTQEEEFDLVYADDLEYLNDIEDVNTPVPVLLSQPKHVSPPQITTPHSTELSILGATGCSQILPVGNLSQTNPVNRRLFGAKASTPYTAKRKEPDEVINQLSSIGLTDNNRKRRLNDLFGDIQDIDAISEIDFEHLAKKPKSEEEIDFETIERILCLRKMNQMSNPLEKNNSLDRFKAWHYRKMQNLSYKEPNWPFIIMRSNDQRIFVRYHSEEFEMDAINEIGIQQRSEESILGEMKQRVWQEAQELIANRLNAETQPMVVDPTLPVPNVNIEGNLWVEKYRPRRYIDLLSDESTNRSLLQWLKFWDKVVFGREPPLKVKPNTSANTYNNKFNTFNKKAGTFQPGGWIRNNKTAPNKEFDEIGRPIQKVALLCGPPGLGKTTLAHILAVHAGYEVREMNASDDRNVDAFRQTLENGTQMQSVLNVDKRPNCIILDEIDGAPQASIDFLIRFVQDNAGTAKGKKKDGKKELLLKRPIICICNDMYVPALRQLRQIAFVVNFPPITSDKLADRLQYISRKEHIKTDMTALLSLSEKTGNDVRSCISMLQFYGGLKKPLLLSDVLKSNIGQKDRHRGLFNVWNSIFQIQRPKSVLQKESDSVTLSDMSETTRMETVVQAVHSGGDYERVTQGVFENYLRQKVSDASMLRTSEALVWFCFNDRIQEIIAQQQNYSVYPYLQYGFVAWHFLFASLAWPKVTFPTKSYEAFQKGTTVKMIITSLKKSIHPSCTGLGAENETLLSSIPSIKRIICPQLRSVSVQLLSPKEKSDLKHAIGVMCDMGICYNQMKVADGTYQFVLEPDLELVSNFTGINSPQLGYWSKQLIAREADLEKVRRAAPSYTDKIDKKKPVDSTKEKKSKNVMKPPVSALPNHLQTLQAKSVKSKKETTTMVSFYPLGKVEKNYRDIVIPQSETHKEVKKLTASALDGKQNMFMKFPKMIDLVLKLNDDVVKSAQFKPILEEKFDLLLLGPFMNLYLVGFGAILNCPIIIFSMAGTFNVLNNIVGNPFELSYVPHFIYGVKGPMNFKQRLMNIGLTVGETGIMWYMQKENRKMYIATFGDIPEFPSYDDQLKNVSLIFINDHFTQSGNRPLVHNMVHIGGIQVKEYPDPLPDDISNWMESNPNGVIYFSLGSNIKSSSLSPDKLQTLLKTFSKLKQNVLWKFENDQIDGLPKNVMIRKWLPQDDLLTHPNLKLFITHGGLGSVAEAKYHAVPLVLIPIFGDQKPNAENVVDEGWGILLQYADLTEETLTKSIDAVLTNSKYKKTVQQWSNLYRDRPHSARQSVVYWTNYVLRYNGAPHLQSFAKELNFFQRHSIDTFGFIFAVMFLILFIQYKLIKFTIKYVVRKLSKNKNKTD